MATFPVKWYASDMQGAPTWGIPQRAPWPPCSRRCWSTGFGTLTVNSLVWDATENAAKATISGGHAYSRTR